MYRLTLHSLALPACALLLASLPQTASAAVFIVNSTQDIPEATAGNGTCNPVGAVGNTCTLRAAIMEANALPGSHTILVASGTYSLTRSGNGEENALNGDLDIKAPITLSNLTSNPPMLFGNHQDRLFDIHPNGALTIFNMALSGGFANAPNNTRGGAFNVQPGGSLSLERVVVASNVANIGGAIYNDGNVTIVDSEFFNNALFDDQVLSSLVDGTAIFSRGQLSIERSTLRNNGVVPGAEGLLTDRSVIRARRTGTHPDPFTRLVNVTVVDNTRGIYSGTVGESTQGMPLDIQMSTIVRNGPLGVRFIPHTGFLAQPQLTMGLTVVFGHSFSDCNQIFSSEPWSPVADRGNASGDESCGFDGATDQQNISDPFFGELDFHGGLTPVLLPHPDRTLVDTGALSCAPSFEDQRGFDRPINATGALAPICDIGAVEYNPASDPVPPPLPDTLFEHGFED